MKRDTRTKLMALMTAAAVLMLSLLSGVVIISMSDILRERIMNDYGNQIAQACSMMTYRRHALKQMVVEIAGDEQVQQATVLKPEDHSYAFFAGRDAVGKALRKQLVRNTDVVGIDFLTREQIAFSTDRGTKDSILETASGGIDRDTIFDDDKDRFTGLFSVSVTRDRENDVMAYIQHVNNYLTQDTNYAVIILYFRASFLTGPLEDAFSDADYVSLTSNDGSELYRQGVYSDKSSVLTFTDDTMDDGWLLTVQVPTASAMQQVNTMILMLLGLTLLILCGFSLTVIPLINRWTKPICQLTDMAHEIARGNLDVNMTPTTKDELGELVAAFSNMAVELKQLMEQQIENEKIHNDLRVNLLMAQINPHFIYNTLDSVIYLAQLGKREETVSMCRIFVSILQDTLHTEGVLAMTTLEKERIGVTEYATLQGYRYPDRFTIVWDLTKDSEAVQVPKLLLQPIVENALFHGILVMEDPGVITVSAFTREGILTITVKDNGIGMDAHQLEELTSEGANRRSGQMHSIGISNIRHRLNLIYHGRASLVVDSRVNEGTTITLTLPLAIEA